MEFTICLHKKFPVICDKCRILTFILCMKTINQHTLFKDLYSQIYQFLAPNKITYEKLVYVDSLSTKWFKDPTNEDEDLPDEYQLEFQLDYKRDEKYWIEMEEDITLVPSGFKVYIFETFDNGHFWDDLIYIPKSCEYLYLGHDGVIRAGDGTESGNEKVELVKSILKALPNLIWIEFCGYHSDIDDYYIEKAAELCNRKIFIKGIY